jgi:hypothetical protein
VYGRVDISRISMLEGIEVCLNDFGIVLCLSGLIVLVQFLIVMIGVLTFIQMRL